MPSFDYLRPLSFYCPIPVIWSTVPVTSKNWTISHRNPGPLPTGIADHFPPESVDQLRRNPHFSLVKNFYFTESVKLQLRGEAFNVTNTPVFGLPNITVGNPGFGVIGSQANQPRNLQIALKLIW